MSAKLVRMPDPAPLILEVATWNGQAEQLTWNMSGNVATVLFCAGRGEPVYIGTLDIRAMLAFMAGLDAVPELPNDKAP